MTPQRMHTKITNCMIHWGLYWPRRGKVVLQYSVSHIPDCIDSSIQPSVEGCKAAITGGMQGRVINDHVGC
jgi:hypothetical protein